MSNAGCMKKPILVTGGAGFIGSHLIGVLVGQRRNVISLDDYSTGRIDNHVDGAEYVRGSTVDVKRLISISPEVVYHLGEYARVERSFEDMGTVWRSNKGGTFAVLEFCRERGAKLVYAGSSTKFGDGGLGRDQSPYAWTKATNTELVINYGSWFGLRHAVTYFYNVYGDREIATGPYATVVGIFKDRFQRGLPLPVVSPGVQRRNFTHVSDIVDGLVRVGERGEGDGYGLGSDDSYSILELARLFGSPIEMLPARRGNRMDTALDTSKARALGWKASRRLSEYVEEITGRARETI